MNMFLGRELRRGPLGTLDRGGMARETQELSTRSTCASRRPVRVRRLSGGQRQGVAIARATHWASSLVLMDEPTAALGVAETAKVEELILRLRERGAAILIVSHNLDQVFRIADRDHGPAARPPGRRPARSRRPTHNDLVAMITGLST